MITLSVHHIETPDRDNILQAFSYMVVDYNGNAWFGADTFEEAQQYINLHNNL